MKEHLAKQQCRIPDDGSIRPLIYLRLVAAAKSCSWLTFFSPFGILAFHLGITMESPFFYLSRRSRKVILTSESPSNHLVWNLDRHGVTFIPPSNHLEAEVSFSQEKGDSKVTYPVAGQL